MKKALLTLAIVALAGAVHAQLADWTFEGTPVSTSLTGTDYNYGAADSGSNAIGSDGTGHHATSSTFSFPAGNGSAKALSANNWAVGDYWQFTLNSLGDTGLKLDWDQAGSGTGPRDFVLAYSTDGSTFTNFASYTVSSTSFSTATANTANHLSFDLSSVPAVNNQASVFFRLIDNSTTSITAGVVGTGGTDRVDNFVVSLAGTAVPEPSILGLIAVGVVAGALKLRKRS